MRDGLDGNHGIYSGSVREGGAVHDIEVAYLPRLSLRVSRGSLGRAAHTRAAHDMERKEREPPSIPAGGIHGLREASERAAPPGFIRAPLRVRRKDQLRARGFQDARRANEAVSKVIAIKGGERVMRNRATFTVYGYATAVAIPQQCPNAHGVRKFSEQQTIMFRLAPRKNGGLDGWLQRGGFVLHAVIAAQKTKLIGINGLHGAFPRANLFAEDAGNVGDRVKVQMTADVLVTEAGAQQQRGRVNGAARGDYRFAADADALAATRARLHANGAAPFHANTLGARLYKKPRACFLRVGKP